MLDLKNLERKLDSALEKESNASLKEWLSSKRFKGYFGDKKFESRTVFKQKASFEFSTDENNLEVSDDRKIVNSNISYDLAA
jgi:hypothetical protein